MFILHAHLVFVTRYQVFAARHPARMEQITADARADFGTEPAEFNGEPERVHLLVNVPPTVAISRLASNLIGGVLPQAATGISGPGPALLARNGCVRSYVAGSAGAPIPVPCPVHRAAEPSRRTGSRPSAFTTGLKAGALTDNPVAE